MYRFKGCKSFMTDGATEHFHFCGLFLPRMKEEHLVLLPLAREDECITFLQVSHHTLHVLKMTLLVIVLICRMLVNLPHI